MSFFKKKKKVESEIVENQNNWVVDNQSEIVKEETVSHQLYDETIITKRVKVRCKICGIYMYVNHTKVIRTPRKLEVLPLVDEEPVYEEINPIQSQIHESVHEELIVENVDEVIEQPKQLFPEEIVEEVNLVESDIHTNTDEESTQNLEQEEYVLDKIYEPIHVEESEIQSLVFEEQEPKHEFKPVNFEFAKPKLPQVDGVVYTEDNFLESEYSEKNKKKKIDTSLVDQYFRSYNKKDIPLLEEMIYNNEVEKEYAYLVKNIDVDPYDEIYDNEDDHHNHSKKHKKEKKFSWNWWSKLKKSKQELQEPVIDLEDEVLEINSSESHQEVNVVIDDTKTQNLSLDNEPQTLEHVVENKVNNNVQNQKEFVSKYNKKKTWWETEVHSKK